jgi:hypothetical protein
MQTSKTEFSQMRPASRGPVVSATLEAEVEDAEDVYAESQLVTYFDPSQVRERDRIIRRSVSRNTGPQSTAAETAKITGKA